MDISEAISVLAYREQEAEEISSQMKAMVESVTQSADYQDLQERLAEVRSMDSALRDDIRSAAIDFYTANGNKKPHDAVSVKVFTVVKIADEAKAREWCMTNFRPALKLDAKVFEKAAKDGTVPAELAMVEEEPRAQIATDLSKYL